LPYTALPAFSNVQHASHNKVTKTVHNSLRVLFHVPHWLMLNASMQYIHTLYT